MQRRLLLRKRSGHISVAIAAQKLSLMKQAILNVARLAGIRSVPAAVSFVAQSLIFCQCNLTGVAYMGLLRYEQFSCLQHQLRAEEPMGSGDAIDVGAEKVYHTIYHFICDHRN